MSNRTYGLDILPSSDAVCISPEFGLISTEKKLAEIQASLEVKEERQLACIAEAARSKGYTRPTWTSESLLL